MHRLAGCILVGLLGRCTAKRNLRRGRTEGKAGKAGFGGTLNSLGRVPYAIKAKQLLRKAFHWSAGIRFLGTKCAGVEVPLEQRYIRTNTHGRTCNHTSGEKAQAASDGHARFSHNINHGDLSKVRSGQPIDTRILKQVLGVTLCR